MLETQKNYSGQDLTGQSFAGRDLMGFNFTNANLTDVNFAGAIITDADFSGATFNRTLMVGTQMEKAKNIPEDYSGIIHNVRLDYLCGKLNHIIPSIQQKLSDAAKETSAERLVERTIVGGRTPSAGWRLNEIQNAQNVLAEILNPMRSSASASK